MVVVAVLLVLAGWGLSPGPAEAQVTGWITPVVGGVTGGDTTSTGATFGITMVDGLLNLEDFEDDTGIELPEGPYETVAGFLIARLGRVPLLGDVVVEAGHSFEVAELDGRRVSRVRVTRVAAQDEGQEAGPSDGPQGASDA